MKARTLLALIACLFVIGCSYNRIVVDCRVQSHVTPLIPVTVAYKLELTR